MSFRGVAQSARALSQLLHAASKRITKHDRGRSVGILPPRPISKFDIRIHEKLGYKDNPYMIRYMINLWLFSIRLHIWFAPDDTRYLHDHAFDFITICLWGYYWDRTDDIQNSDLLTIGAIRFRRAEHKHYVDPAPKTVTLLFCGAPRRKWGFWVNGRKMRPLRYFSRYGHQERSE